MLVRPSPRWRKRRTLYRPVIARRLPFVESSPEASPLAHLTPPTEAERLDHITGD